MVTNIDLIQLNDLREEIHDMLNVVDNSCDEHNNSQCKNSIERINHMLHTIDIDYIVLRQLKVDPILNDTMQFYMKEFENMQSNNVTRKSFSLQQTTLVQSYWRHFGDLFDAINMFKDEMARTISQSVAKLRSCIINFSSVLRQYKSVQNQLVSAIIGAPSSLLVNLVSPIELMEYLTIISNLTLPLGLELPTSIHMDNIPQFYRLIKCNSAIVNNSLLITFTIPLVHSELYTLYKTTSLPHRVGLGMFSYIVPSQEYLAIDQSRSEFLPLTGPDIEATCVAVNYDNSNLVCRKTLSKVWSTSARSCEMDILRGAKELPNCNVQIRNFTTEIWIKLGQPNKHIFVFPNRRQLFVKCHTVDEIIDHDGTAVITYSKDCQLRTNHINIYATNPLLFAYASSPLNNANLNIDDQKTIARADNSNMSSALNDLRKLSALTSYNIEMLSERIDNLWTAIFFCLGIMLLFAVVVIYLNRIERNNRARIAPVSQSKRDCCSTDESILLPATNPNTPSTSVNETYL